jgi:hypothetical protein
MSSRLVAPLLCLAAVVYASGQGALGALAFGSTAVATAAPADGQEKPVARRAKNGPAVEAALAIRVADEVRFALHVVNASEHRLELDFPNGQTREFVVSDSAGREVWRWSHGRLFTQTVQNRLLAAGDTVVFEEKWAAAAPGKYTVEATLRSDNHPLVRRAEFVVPDAGARVAVKQ